ncbi:MAG TPA: adenylyl-sulfate reductase subunit beta [Terriglobales bacterium]|nr:adenylyl-sulfate reductase subunit beta [Terriglobales bacterium]
MPAFAHPERCDGCRGRAQVVCREICPADVMQLDSARGQAVNIEPDLCWECYACVKACPANALEVRGYSDGIALGASLKLHRGEAAIAWEVNFRGGTQKRFRFPIRTTAWGSIRPFAGLPPADLNELRQPGLCGEPRYLGVAALSRLSREQFR